MPNDLIIAEVISPRDQTAFIRLPYRLHKRQTAWVAPLLSEVKDTLNFHKNPFYRHAEIQMFLAMRGKKVVGRIAGIIDRNFIEVRREQIGCFGFFECIDDREAAGKLFDAAADWLKNRNMIKMLGPTNPSMNDELGVLMDSYDLPPVIKMVWNPPYYPALYESNGFAKAMDLWAWFMSREQVSERLMKLGEAILRRTKVTLRHIDMKDFDAEVQRLRAIYNEAWSENWGFVPWTKEEFEHAAKGLKQVVDPNLVLVAEAEGKPVAFSLALPDLNQALKHINGRLFPIGLPILLWHARKIHQVRVAILGVVKEYRGRGIDTAMYYETFRVGTSKGYDRAEMSWVLENNESMSKMLEMMGAKKYKTYRLFQREL